MITVSNSSPFARCDARVGVRGLVRRPHAAAVLEEPGEHLEPGLGGFGIVISPVFPEHAFRNTPASWISEVVPLFRTTG